MGGEECANMKEVASASLSENQMEAQERLLKDQEEMQVEMDLKHAKAVNEMKEELDEDAKIAKDSIVQQMEEQKRKVISFCFEIHRNELLEHVLKICLITVVIGLCSKDFIEVLTGLLMFKLLNSTI